MIYVDVILTLKSVWSFIHFLDHCFR